MDQVVTLAGVASKLNKNAIVNAAGCTVSLCYEISVSEFLFHFTVVTSPARGSELVGLAR